MREPLGRLGVMLVSTGSKLAYNIQRVVEQEYGAVSHCVISPSQSVDQVRFRLEADVRKGWLESIVYLAGEVNDKNRMKHMNVSIPNMIFDYCKQRGLYFIGLSSLSIYELSNDNVITNKSATKAISIYARSKLSHVEYLEKSGYEAWTCIMPGSLIKSWSARDFFSRIQSKKTIRCVMSVLMCLGVKGSIALTDSGDLANYIKIILISKHRGEFTGRRICAYTATFEEITGALGCKTGKEARFEVFRKLTREIARKSELLTTAWILLSSRRYESQYDCTLTKEKIKSLNYPD